METLFEIVHEDDEFLAINKPAGLVCHPTKGDAYSSLIGRIRLHLGERLHPHMVNRLDRETSGIVLVAKNAETALQVRQIWEQRLVQKQYLTMVHGHPRETSGIIDAPLGKDDESRVAIKDRVRQDGAPARTEFDVVCKFRGPRGDFSLLRVQPLTGRKHQIRIHLSHYGHPIVGDKLYGADENLYLLFVRGRLSPAQRDELLLPYQALHAWKVRFCWRGRAIFFCAGPEPWFVDFVSSAYPLASAALPHWEPGKTRQRFGVR